MRPQHACQSAPDPTELLQRATIQPRASQPTDLATHGNTPTLSPLRRTPPSSNPAWTSVRQPFQAGGEVNRKPPDGECGLEASHSIRGATYGAPHTKRADCPTRAKRLAAESCALLSGRSLPPRKLGAQQARKSAVMQSSCHGAHKRPAGWVKGHAVAGKTYTHTLTLPCRGSIRGVHRAAALFCIAARGVQHSHP